MNSVNTQNEERSFGLIYEGSPEEFWLDSREYTEYKPQIGDCILVKNEEYRIGKIGDADLYLIPFKDNERERERESIRIPLNSGYKIKLSTPSYPVLKFVNSIQKSKEKSSQILIQGENLHALKLLTFAYANKIDCIYIDPPYNTGSTDWRYNNKYIDPSNAYRHSLWLSFMEHRLKVAKELLNPEKSVLICAIGEDEVHRLALLLEQVFPGARIQMVSLNTNAHDSKTNEFMRAGEYLFFVMIGKASPLRLELSLDFKLSQNISKDAYKPLQRSGSNELRSDRPHEFYPIFIKDGRIIAVGEPLPSSKHAKDVETPKGCQTLLPILKNGEEGCWQVEAETLRRLINEHRVRIKGKSVSYIAKEIWNDLKNNFYGSFEDFKIDPKDGHLEVDKNDLINHLRFIPPDIWNVPLHNVSDYGTKLLKKLLGSKKFDYPKSLYAVEDAIRFFVADNPNAMILDFFAGSGTTAHAVMRLNKQDGGRRVCVLVTNNENKICDEVTFPRLKAAITGCREDGQKIEGNYKGRDTSPISEGFDENITYFKLCYARQKEAELGKELLRVVPLLWMESKSKSPLSKDLLEKCIKEPYTLLNSFALCTNYGEITEFLTKANGEDTRLAAISTFDQGRYVYAVRNLPCPCCQLPQDYLQAMEMNGEI